MSTTGSRHSGATCSIRSPPTMPWALWAVEVGIQDGAIPHGYGHIGLELQGLGCWHVTPPDVARWGACLDGTPAATRLPSGALWLRALLLIRGVQKGADPLPKGLLIGGVKQRHGIADGVAP